MLTLYGVRLPHGITLLTNFGVWLTYAQHSTHSQACGNGNLSTRQWRLKCSLGSEGGGVESAVSPTVGPEQSPSMDCEEV